MKLSTILFITAMHCFPLSFSDQDTCLLSQDGRETANIFEGVLLLAGISGANKSTPIVRTDEVERPAIEKPPTKVCQQNETATIYFYRPKKLASSRPKIIIGTVIPDEVILKLKNGSWHKLTYDKLGERDLVAGVYVINPEIFTLTFQPEETYYIRCTVLVRGMKVMAELELVDEEIAKNEMKKLKEQSQTFSD